MDRDHWRVAFSQRLRDYPWLGSYIGTSGLILLGMAVFILAHGDWLPGALFSICGVSVLVGARNAHRRR
jgi:hypothetical protein